MIMRTDLEEKRNRIDELDEAIATALAKRFALTDEIGALKKENGVPLVDKTREQKVLSEVRKYAGEYADAVEETYRTVLKLSVKRQEDVCDGANGKKS